MERFFVQSLRRKKMITKLIDWVKDRVVAISGVNIISADDLL